MTFLFNIYIAATKYFIFFDWLLFYFDKYSSLNIYGDLTFVLTSKIYTAAPKLLYPFDSYFTLINTRPLRLRRFNVRSLENFDALSAAGVCCLIYS